MLENNAQQTGQKCGLCMVGTGLTNLPSHYMMLLITREMASLRFFDPRLDIGGVIFANLRREVEVGGKES